MPYYDGNDPDVIPVYESSAQFQGFLIQSYEKLKEVDADYYLFVADDMIINPAFNENNILNCLKMNGKAFGICTFRELNTPKNFEWMHARYSSKAFLQNWTEWKNNLPSYSDALMDFCDFFGHEYKEIYEPSFFGNAYNGSQYDAFVKMNGNSLNIPYPMAGGYSDVFMIQKDWLYQFSRINGIFASMNLFVEIAIPTATVLLLKKETVTFLDQNDHFYAKVMWNDDRAEYIENTEHNYESLKKSWDPNCMFIHPIKLSTWEV